MAKAQQKPNDSSFKSSAWLSQITAWTMTADLWQSPLFIREQGDVYLEKFPKENVGKYEKRLARSVPRNKFRESIETMAGMVFKDDPAPQDIPDALSELFTDIDACGNSLHSFLLTAFERYLRDGGGAIWVDATPLSDTAKTKAEAEIAITAADRMGDRPFWSFVEARQIINHRYKKINGVDVLSQVTIQVDETEPDGEFGEIAVTRHYILRRGSFEVRRYNAKDKEFVIEPDKGGNTGLTEIPLVPLAPFGTPPPMLDLAMLTIDYYNQMSDFRNWCHTACVPRQVIQLADESDATKYKSLNQSAEVGLILFGESAKAYYLEVSGAGLELAKANIADTATEMAAIGVGMLAPSEVAPKSATEVLDTAGQRQSKLARFAREFENSVEKAFYFTAEYLKNINGAASIDLDTAEDVSLKLRMDFDRLTFTPERMQIFKDLMANGDFSRETFFEILAKSEDMPEDWTPELELKRLKDEEATLTPVLNARMMPNETQETTTPGTVPNPIGVRESNQARS